MDAWIVPENRSVLQSKRPPALVIDVRPHYRSRCFASHDLARNYHGSTLPLRSAPCPAFRGSIATATRSSPMTTPPRGTQSPLGPLCSSARKRVLVNLETERINHAGGNHDY